MTTTSIKSTIPTSPLQPFQNPFLHGIFEEDILHVGDVLSTILLACHLDLLLSKTHTSNDLGSLVVLVYQPEFPSDDGKEFNRDANSDRDCSRDIRRRILWFHDLRTGYVVSFDK